MLKTTLMTGLISILLIGCGRVHVSHELIVPNRPALPRVADKDLSCIPDRAYRALVQRDMELRHHVERLETIIESTRD